MMLDHDVKNIGLYTRSVTEGEELELVKEFIDYYVHNFFKNNKITNLAVFIEPQIASGFPDIVFASYSAKIIDDWSDWQGSSCLRRLFWKRLRNCWMRR